MTRKRKYLILAAASLVVVVGVVGALALVKLRADDLTQLDLGSFEQAIADGEVAEATIHDGDDRVTGTLVDGREFEARYPELYADELTSSLLGAGVDPEVKTSSSSLWSDLLLQVLPVVLIGAVLFWLFTSMRGSGSMGRMKRGKARTQEQGAEPDVTFADVAGCDEAVAELGELRDFLVDPDRFAALGANVPRGVLIVGPPGTGKTLLARAVAGEAGVPFFSLSGSDFVEMYVGVGASRVRNLFDDARKAAPAIVFVDEIDAVGRHRGAGVGGGHDEREQTLNQLLVEMDGFDDRSGVIFIGATNRPDILDPALLRPGRFDRQVVVDEPDVGGRRAILDVHTAGAPLADDVDLDVVARRSPGLTGADLANLANEAAILAARAGESTISMRRFEEAADRILAGPERRSRLLTDAERSVVATHESGHAIIGHVLATTDPIHKVSIVARGRALGWTLALPEYDRSIRTRRELLDRLAMLLGGRTAEEIVFGDPSTGAEDDIEQATELARAMVCRFGMSEQIGPLQLGTGDGEVFLGKDLGHEQNYSDEVAARIDEEVHALVEGAHQRARKVLQANEDLLDTLAAALVAAETLAGHELEKLLAGARDPAAVDSRGGDDRVIARD